MSDQTETASKPRLDPATMPRYRVTISVDGEDVFTHECRTNGGLESAAEFAAQVWLLGRDRSDLVGKKITATPELIEEDDRA